MGARPAGYRGRHPAPGEQQAVAGPSRRGRRGIIGHLVAHRIQAAQAVAGADPDLVAIVLVDRAGVIVDQPFRGAVVDEPRIAEHLQAALRGDPEIPLPILA